MCSLMIQETDCPQTKDHHHKREYEMLGTMAILYTLIYLKQVTISYIRHRSCVIIPLSTWVDSSSESGHCCSECVQQ